jgi:hypothetical protein
VPAVFNMKILYSPVFIICVVLFVAHQLTQKVLGIPIPPADSYLDNLVTPPILFTLVIVERRILFKRGPGYTLNIMETTMGTVLIALISEVLFPYLSSDFTADLLDVLFYVLGSILFYTTINKRNR